MTPAENKNQTPTAAGPTPVQVEQRLAKLEAQLDTYKKTLTEIYDLYDKKIEELSLIRRLGDSIRTPLDLETLCRRVVEAVAHEIAVDRLALILMASDRKGLLVSATYGEIEDETCFYSEEKARLLLPGQTEARQAFQTGRQVLITSGDPAQDPLGRDIEPPVSLLFLPLVARDETVGLFSLSRAEGHPFGDDDIRLLTIISDQAATALANVQLFDALAKANIGLQDSERQARQASLYLENLLETANDVIFTLDDQGRVTYVNRKVEQWGYNKDSLSGRSFEELVAHRNLGDEVTARLMNQPGQTVEVGLLTREGQVRDVLLSASHIRDESSGALTGLVLLRDITERNQLEKQLFHSEKLASIGILAAGLAHEIGNPLSAISGYTQILHSGDVSEEQRSEFLSAIEEQTARIQNIIQDLLNYSRPSAGLTSEIDLAEAVPQILSMLTSQRAFKGLDLAYDFTPDLPLVVMDRDHLTQIVINLALNAAQAMDAGGRLEVGLSREKDQAVLRFTDSGPGVPPELQNKVFEPFFTTKSQGQGTGLGLAICFRIVDSYKGSIELKSEPGRGATFLVRLPASTKDGA